VRGADQVRDTPTNRALKDILAVMAFDEFSPSFSKSPSHRRVRHQCEALGGELSRRIGYGQVDVLFYPQPFTAGGCGHDRLPVRECLENLDSSASSKSEWYDDDTGGSEVRRRIRNGAGDDDISTGVQRPDLLGRLTTDDVHMSAWFHASDMWQDRLAEVDGGIDIRLIVHLAEEEQSVRIFAALESRIGRQVHTIGEDVHIVIAEDPAVFFRADQHQGGSLAYAPVEPFLLPDLDILEK
jgi:hypothetical protein